MTTTLMGLKLSDRTLSALSEILERTRDTGNEHGFAFCVDHSTGEVIPNDPCAGTTCSIRIVRKCPVGRSVGSVHTHPSGTTALSLGDALQALSHQDATGRPSVNCVLGAVPIWRNPKDGPGDRFELICHRTRDDVTPTEVREALARSEPYDRRNYLRNHPDIAILFDFHVARLERTCTQAALQLEDLGQVGI